MVELSTLTKSSLWGKVQSQLSALYQVPIRIVDQNGAELLQTGAFPFLYDIVRNKHLVLFQNELAEVLSQQKTNFICIANLTNILHYLEQGAIVIGPIKTESIPKKLSSLSKMTGIEEEELLEEYNKIPLSSLNNIKTIPLLAAEIFPVISHYDAQISHKLQQQQAENRVNKIFSSRNIDRVAKDLLSFLSSTFSLKNCVLWIANKPQPYLLRTTLWSELLWEKLLEVAAKSKGLYALPSLASDLAFASMQEAKTVKDSLLLIPIRIKDELAATLILIAEKNKEYSRSHYDFLNTLTSHLHNYLADMQHLQGIQTTAITDRLTKLFNRRHFDHELQNQILICRDQQQPISLILFDIDNFKHFNDTFGHTQGDIILQELAKIMTQSIRQPDTACRYGGEEFALILPNTKHDNAQMIAERLRIQVQNHSFGHVEKEKQITISLGLATCLNSSIGLSQLLQEADTALYKAKGNGKNRTESVLIVDKNLSSIDVNEAMKT